MSWKSERAHDAHVVTRAIALAYKDYCELRQTEPPHYASNWWRMVFMHYYDNVPLSDEDQRWDHLLLEASGAGGLTLALLYRESGCP